MTDAKENGDNLIPLYSYDPSSMRPVEFIVDGFLSTGVTLIAGSPGVGKTTALVSMACIVAGLMTAHEAGGIKATLPRRVYYVTEDAPQVARILFGMKACGMICGTDAEIKDWFRIVNAVRRSPEEIAKMIEAMREEGTVESPEELRRYKCEPLSVLDTSNATLDLDNENDNSQAGRAIAAIKGVLGNASIWLVGHTSKSLKRADLKDLSFRGAGAFEGDCHAVSYIFQDGEGPKSIRYWALGKHRYEAEYGEVRIDGKADFVKVETPWGIDQLCWYRIGYLSKSSLDQRNQEKKAAIEKRESEELDQTKLEILDLFKTSESDPVTLIRAEIKDRITKSGAHTVAAINALVKSCALVESQGKGRAKILSLNPNAAQQPT
jgi:AAA domain